MFAEQALREVPSDKCLECGKPFSKDDVFYLNPLEDDQKVNAERAERKQATEKAAKEERRMHKKYKSQDQDGETFGKRKASPSPADKSSPTKRPTVAVPWAYRYQE